MAKKQITPPVNLNDPVALAAALKPLWDKAPPLLARINELVAQRLNPHPDEPVDPFGLREAWGQYLDYALARPEKTMARQMMWWQDCLTLCQQNMMRFMGQDYAPIKYEVDQGDRRFKTAEWEENPYFNTLKQTYILTSQHILDSLNDFEGLDEQTRDKLDFALRQYIAAASPSNFLFTNPEVLKETLETGGQNLLKGLEHLIRDLERGHGELKISMTDYNAFEPGRNIAVTKGAVIFKNRLMELIQYAPTTKDVYKTPLLVIPPWINKYYVLDLRPENSFVKWLVDQGHTVFIMSWVNPTEKTGDIEFEDYMNEGLLRALTEIEAITGEKQTNVIGYCIGGTLLAMTLSWLHEKKKQGRIKTSTFLTTLIDFSDAGELKLFTTEDQIEVIEHQMNRLGYLPAEVLKTTFTMLRANDLIWSFVVNNYLLGKDPFPFDLLYWNDDSTNLPAKMHSYYLRNLYLENRLNTPGSLTFGGVKMDIRNIQNSCYFVSTREDHIAPWTGTYAGFNEIGSDDKQFTLAASGHIAGVVNPPAKNKYCYWASPLKPDTAKAWLEETREIPGSWWPHWQEWIATRSPEQVKARKITTPLYPAPGKYIRKSEE